MRVTLTKEDLDRCREYAEKAWSRTGKAAKPSATPYDKGADPDIEYYGKAGEVGFGYLVGLEADFKIRRGGDDYDFLIFGHTFDVKTTRNPKMNRSLIRVTNDGRPIQPIKDFVICCLFEEPDVEVLGWRPRSWILDNAPICPSWRFPDTFNRELMWGKLRPMEELLKVLGK